MGDGPPEAEVSPGLGCCRHRWSFALSTSCRLWGSIQCDMVSRMTALISWVFRLIHGDLYQGARHRLTSAVTSPVSWAYLGTRKGWRYRTPDHRWMDARDLIAKVRARDMLADTHPLRWYERDGVLL